MGLDRLHGLEAVAALADDRDLVLAVEQLGQKPAGRLFVVDDQHAQRRGLAHANSASSGIRSSTRNRCGFWSTTTTARSP